MFLAWTEFSIQHFDVFSMHVLLVSFLCAAEVYSATWWMMAYGAATPKRQIAKSNWIHVDQLDLGKMARSLQKENTKFKTSSFLDAM